jgi:leucyl/phenylalanyl-tRNA--protein transferase
MIFLLDDQYPSLIPDPEKADENGMVAVSETLGTKRLIAAYQKGIFPWMKMEQEPNYWCWFSPEPRMVLKPYNLKISRSLKKALLSESFEIRIDDTFEDTMRSCAKSPRPGQESTWIEEDMIRDYTKLHELGITHSIETYHDGKKVGGLYGLAMGKMFFGESMFHIVPEASKICLAHLVQLSCKYGIELIDCQAHTPHLEKMGAGEIPRNEFFGQLKNFLKDSQSVIPWKELAESSTLARLPEN